MDYLEGFFAGPPTSYWDYVLSPHILPLAASFVFAIVLFLCGAGCLWPFVVLCAGGAACVVMFVLLPLPILGPVGGKYHVGIRYIHSRGPEMMPPLVVFYPTRVMPQKEGVSYIPFGDICFLNGIATRAKMPLYFLRDFLFVRLRASPNATPVPLFNDSGAPLPVVVFSHGLYGYHQLYGCLLSDLAARGVVAVAIGHMDGSAAFMRDAESGGKEVRLKDADWESPLADEALAHRVLEMRQTLRRLKERSFWVDVGFAEFDVQRYLRQSPRVQLSGHSFGGATALTAAMQEEQESGACKSAAQSVVVFDPWHIPLRGEHFFRPIANARMSYTTPTLMIHSDSWVHNESSWNFFRELTNIILNQSSLSSLVEQEKRSLFVTMKTRDTNHYSVSDIVLLSPVLHGNMHAMVPPRAQIVEWSNMVLHFLNRHKTVTRDRKSVV